MWSGPLIGCVPARARNPSECTLRFEDRVRQQVDLVEVGDGRVPHELVHAGLVEGLLVLADAFRRPRDGFGEADYAVADERVVVEDRVLRRLDVLLAQAEIRE